MLYLKSYRHTQYHLGFFLCYSRIFTVLHFTFRSVIHLEAIFVKDVKPVPRFSFLFSFACECPVVIASFVEKTIVSPLYCLCSYIKDQLSYMVKCTLQMHTSSNLDKILPIM